MRCQSLVCSDGIAGKGKGGAEQIPGLVLDCVSALVSSWLPREHQGNSAVPLGFSYQGFSVLQVASRKGNCADKSACAQLHMSHHLK